MVGAKTIHELSAIEWRRLDGQLAQLLELAPKFRAQRIAQWSTEFPDTAHLLDQLLASASDEAALTSPISAALEFIAGDTPLPSGTLIGAWRLQERIGHGGMAEVYRAQRADGAFERSVALKVLWRARAHAQAEPQVRRERQFLADLNDPRIADIVDGGITSEGRPWLATEWVEGRRLADACEQDQANFEARIHYLIEVADALAHAHQQLVVHGDVKSSNILVNDSGHIKLLDFGISRFIDDSVDPLEADQPTFGLTPEVASPEQRAGQPPTPASDVYQLGLLLKSLIQEHAPRGARRRSELNRILDHALAEHASHRYRTASQLSDDLKAMLAHQPVAAHGGGVVYRLACFIRRHWVVNALACGLLALGLIGLLQQFRYVDRLDQRNQTNEAVLAYLQDMLLIADPQNSSISTSSDAQLLEVAKLELNRRLVNQPRAQARVLNSLGEIHFARNELLQAADRYRDALILAQHEAMPEVQIQALEGLSAIGIWTGNYARSEQRLHELFALRQAYGGSASELNQTRLKLADLLHSRGRYAAALALAEQAHALNLNPAWSGRVLGMIRRDLGQFDQARQLFDATHAVLINAQTESQDRLAELSDHRIILALHSNQLQQAKAHLARSTQLRAGYLGDQWRGLNWNNHWAGVLALFEGDLSEASIRLDQMIIDYILHLGEDSHLLAFARSDRAWVALGQSDINAANTLFTKAAQRLETLHPDPHPRLAEIWLGQALIALYFNQPDRALALSQQALSSRQQLPFDSTGATAWRANACQLVQWSGGRCSIEAPTAVAGLDSRKLQHATAGICRMDGISAIGAYRCNLSGLAVALPNAP
ncbi:MAG: serine/threonine-protein kinase [Pseudomonadota bacterium]